MTKPTLFLLFLTVPFAINTAFAQIATNRTISVDGDAVVRVVPDRVQVALTAEDRADLMTAKRRNDQAVSGLITYATKTLGVNSRDIQTDFVRVEPIYRACNYQDELAGKCSPLDIVYYSVRKGIQIQLRDTSKYEDLITQALQLGVNNIDNIEFHTSELRKHRDKARQMAAAAALDKANAIAASLGAKVGKPLSISTRSYTSFYTPRNNRFNNVQSQNIAQQQGSSGPADNDDSDLAVGQISVTAEVIASFELQ